MAAYYPNNTVTTEHIQQYLDENKSLILKIVESQNSGKISECAENQARLQRNLMYLAAIADSQPQPPTMHSQFPPSGVMQSGPAHYMMQQQQLQQQQNQQMMSPQALMLARSTMLYNQQHHSYSSLQQQQQQQLYHSHLGMSSGGGGGSSSGLHHMLQTEPGGGSLFPDYGRGVKQDLMGGGASSSGGGDGAETLYLKSSDQDGI
jgi:hypothetical protein